MTFERSTDYALIRQIMTDPAVWGGISDDFTASPEDWQPIQNEQLIYVVVRDGEGVILGLWLLVPHSAVKFEVHTVLLPSCGYSRGRLAAREMAAWIWENTNCQRLFTIVPRCNRAAAKFAKAAGMTYFGCNERAFAKGGKLEDELYFGLSRPAVALGKVA